jgi:hypothetical protein
MKAEKGEIRFGDIVLLMVRKSLRDTQGIVRIEDGIFSL